MPPIGFFGGTFDPIHCGHLRTAFELWRELGLAEVRFLPTGSPPHRAQLYASAELRLKMVEAAGADQPGVVVDDREGRRSGGSYSVDTLTELRCEYPHRSLCLLLGMDAFLGLPNWHRWRELLTLAHIIVAHRPGWRAQTTRPLRVVTQLEISSTDLRALIIGGRDPRYLVPEAVRQIILETRCYAPRQDRGAS